jgi:hypothetical protein
MSSVLPLETKDADARHKAGHDDVIEFDGENKQPRGTPHGV